MEFFEEFKNLYTKDIKVDSSAPVKNGYMLTRFISFDPGSFWQATEVNGLLRGLPQWAVGCLLFNLIARQRAPYTRYPKGGKAERNLLVEKTMNYFKCNSIHAEQIVLICEKIKIDLYTKFGIGRGNVSNKGSGRGKKRSRN